VGNLEENSVQKPDPLLPWQTSMSTDLTQESQVKILQAQLQQEIQYRKQLESSLQESQICLRLLSSISKSMAAGLGVEEIITATVTHMGDYFTDRRISYAILDQGKLTAITAVHPETEDWFQRPRLKIPLDKAPECWRLLHRRQPLIIEDVLQEPLTTAIALDLQQVQVRSILIIPLQQPTQNLGVLCFDLPNAHSWSPYEIATLAEIVDYLGLVIQEAMAQQQRQRAQAQLRLLESVVVNSNDSVLITIPNIDNPRIIYANAAFTRMTGYSLVEVLDRTPHLLQGAKSDRVKLSQVRQRLSLGLSVQMELINYRKDGSEYWVDLNIVPLFSAEGNLQYFVSIQRDITERKLAETRIYKSLQEKEVMLKEIHHRVKNNLQVVSSLLKLQVGHLKAERTDENTIAALTDSQYRVRAMALVHEKLYQGADLARTDFASYAQQLAQDLLRAYGDRAKLLQVRTKVEDVHLSLDSAIPCGLMINELVSNALKYAFPAIVTPDSGWVEIQLYLDEDDQYVLTVQDNGIGFPNPVDFHNTSTLGLQLVWSLTQQMQGSISCQTSPQSGSTFQIIFRDRPPLTQSLPQ
jgi:PAS domain S-box-containing protein